MTTIIAITSIIVFAGVFWISGIVRVANQAIGTSRYVIETLSSNEINDGEKETAAQKAAIVLLKSAVSIGVRFALCLLAAAIPVYAADLLGLSLAGEVIDFLSRWDVITVSSVVILVLWLVGRRLWRVK